MTKKCPKCDKKMEVVKFQYKDEVCIPDGIKRYMCLDCGYQKAKRWRI